MRQLSDATIRRVCLLSVLLWLIFIQRAGAQPDALLTARPLQTQTVAGVTVRLLRLRWVWPREVWGGNEKDDPNLRMLGYWFDVVEGGKPRSSYAMRMRQLGPFGETLQQSSIFYQSTVCWGGFSPRWPHAALEFDLLDRGANPEAGGEFNTPLEFKAIPVPPPEPGLIQLPQVKLQRTLISEHGTAVSIEQVVIRRHDKDANGQRSGPDDVEFLVRWVAPPQYPDAQVQVGLHEGSVHDDTGQDLTRVRQVGGVNWAGYNDTGNDIIKEVNGGQTVLFVHNLPAPQARNLDVRLWVRETIPSLKLRNKVRQFHFDFDPRHVPFEKKFAVAPLAVGASADCQVTMESMKLYSQDQCLFTIVTKDTLPAPDASWPWAVERWQLTRNHKTCDAFEVEPTGGPGFHNDGTPLQDNELSQTLHGVLLPSAVSTDLGERRTRKLLEGASPDLTSDTSAPPPCDLELQLRREQMVSRVADFPALPLPAPGQEFRLDRAINLPDGSRIVVRSVHYVTEPEQVSDDRLGRPFGSHYDRPSVQRLEFRLELEPAAGTREKFSYRRNSTAVDNLGYALWPVYGLGDNGGDGFYLIKLFAPLPGATSFNLHLLFDTVRLGESQKLVLHDVPMPTEQP